MLKLTRNRPMNLEKKPFDRKEAFEILLAWLPNGAPMVDAIEAAIKDAQLFNEVVANATPRPEKDKTFKARHKFGEFTPSGYSLYFVTHDGAHFLIAEFRTIQACVTAAIAMNAFLPSSNYPAAAADRVIELPLPPLTETLG